MPEQITIAGEVVIDLDSLVSAVSEINGDSLISEVDVASVDIPQSFLLLINGSILLPSIDFQISEGVLSFPRGISHAMTVSIIDLTNGQVTWSWNPIKGTTYPVPNPD